MDFALGPEQAMIGDLARQLFADHATSARTRAAMAGDGLDRDLWTAFAEAGLTGTAIPDAYGGTGLGLVDTAIIAEAAGHCVAAAPVIASALCSAALVAGGSDLQRAQWLPRLAAGEAIGTIGEPAPHGAVADLLIAQGKLVDLTGMTAAPQTSMDQTRPLARLDITGAAAEPLADPDAADAIVQRWGWTLIAADSLGGAEACLARTVAYAKERSQFGHPIGTFQAVKHALADVAIAIEQARSAVYWAAAEPEGSPDVLLAAHAAKAVACEAYSQAASAMIQIHGGIGFTWEHDAHLFFKRAQANRSWMGAPDWHFDRIADLMLPRAA